MEAKSLPSPRNSHSSNSSSSSSSNSSNDLQLHQLPTLTATAPPPPPPPAAYPPKPVTRSESANPYPTTFVQADTSSFKQVVQMLTGSTETAKQAASANYSKPHSEPNKTHNTIPPIKKSGFKLYERRNSLKHLNINPLLPSFSSNGSGFSPRKPEVLSPSILDFPSLVLSPVTPLIPDPFDRSRFALGNNGAVSVNLDAGAEERAIKEKGYYLHPFPGTTPRDSEPRLLPLFPTTSPGVSGSSSSSSP